MLTYTDQFILINREIKFFMILYVYVCVCMSVQNSKSTYFYIISGIDRRQVDTNFYSFVVSIRLSK